MGERLFKTELSRVTRFEECKLQRIHLEFRRWTGKHWWEGRSVPPTWTSKPEVMDPLNHKGTIAEVAILSLLQKQGWECRWVNNFSRSFMKGLPVLTKPEPLPDKQKKLFDKIVQKVGRRKGFWDILAWQGNKLLFIESKGPRDTMKPAQWIWLGVASELCPSAEFVIVEWSYHCLKSKNGGALL